MTGFLSQYHENRVLIGIVTIADSRSTDFNYHPRVLAQREVQQDVPPNMRHRQSISRLNIWHSLADLARIISTKLTLCGITSDVLTPGISGRVFLRSAFMPIVMPLQVPLLEFH